VPLPAAVDGKGATPAALSPVEVRGEAIGGGGFHDALSVTPGASSGTVQPGERLFYKVRADWGRSVSVTVRFLANPRAASQLGKCGGQAAIALRADIAVQQNANGEHHYQDDIQLTVAVTGERTGIPGARPGRDVDAGTAGRCVGGPPEPAGAGRRRGTRRRRAPGR
jgi:hypothetical protein